MKMKTKENLSIGISIELIEHSAARIMNLIARQNSRQDSTHESSEIWL